MKEITLQTRFNESEIKKVLVEIAKEVHPWYREIKPRVSVYNKEKYIGMKYDKVRLEINYDNFGYIEDRDGKLVAEGYKLRVGHIMEVASIEEGVRFLVEEYFR